MVVMEWLDDLGETLEDPWGTLVTLWRTLVAPWRTSVTLWRTLVAPWRTPVVVLEWLEDLCDILGDLNGGHGVVG